MSLYVPLRISCVATLIFCCVLVQAEPLYTDDLTKSKPLTVQQKRLASFEHRILDRPPIRLPRYYIDTRLGLSEVFLSSDNDALLSETKDFGLAYGVDIGYQLNNFTAFELGMLSEPNEVRKYNNQVELYGRHNQAVNLLLRYNITGSRYDTDMEAWIKGGVSWVHHELKLANMDDFSKLSPKIQERVGVFDCLGGYAAIGIDWAPYHNWGISTEYELIVTNESKMPTVSTAAIGIYYLF